MRAVVARRGELHCEEIADLHPGKGQVLVQTLCCGICGSDLHALHNLDRIVEVSRRAKSTLAGGLDTSKDVVFGHEFSAEILDYGPNCEAVLKTGTRIVSMPFMIGPSGPIIISFSNLYPGGFAERMLLQETMLIPIPNGLSYRDAALTEPFAVGAHAAGMAALEFGQSAALVVGCGPVGLAVIASLKARGYGPVIAADFSPTRRAMAERMGADIIVDPAIQSPHEKWPDAGVAVTELEQMIARMAGKTVKRAIIFDCVGVPGMLQNLIEAAPNGAQIIVVGLCMETDRFEPSMAIFKQIDLRFVFGYSAEEFNMTLNNIAEGRIDVAPLITGIVGLDGVAQAFHDLADPEQHVKILIEPSLP